MDECVTISCRGLKVSSTCQVEVLTPGRVHLRQNEPSPTCCEASLHLRSECEWICEDGEHKVGTKQSAVQPVRVDS